MYIRPETLVENVPKISKKIIPALHRLDVFTLRDLLFHFPARYDDLSNKKNIEDVHANETVTVRGKIQSIRGGRTFHKKLNIVEIEISDETGRLKAVWFGQPFLARTLRVGDVVQLAGKTVLQKNILQLQNPSYEKIKISKTNTDYVSSELHTSGLVAIYPETAGITSRWLRFLMHSFFDLRNNLPDYIPEEIRGEHDLLPLAEALASIHFPPSHEEAEFAQRRFTFEELFLMQLSALRERAKLKQHRAPIIPTDIPLMKRFIETLPFALTDAQRRSMWEILQDIAKPQPMNRLLEGDVGSGKTVVAAAVTLMTVHAGYRVAFMAPTEILANQHYATLSRMLALFNIPVGLLTASQKNTSSNASVIVGTHALIQKNISFKNLALVVIDEQHRFGVEQRATLLRDSTAQKKNSDQFIPHFLSMSATPIPRTLALTIYGNLDLSILDEMPKSRKKIITKIISPTQRTAAYKFVREEVQRGRQVFVVCPRIEKPDETKPPVVRAQQQLALAEVKAVKQEYEKLSKEIFPDLTVAMLHGKMRPKEKEEIMSTFKKGKTDILVSTSVIEVGVDIPNASIMMIEGAERFGLAQLHQFRGRVGRGAEQSYCLLFSTEGNETRRLQALVRSSNGFELAEEDLKIRGPGDLLGSQQSGIPNLVLKGLTDANLVREVREATKKLVATDPTLTKHPELRKKLLEMEREVHSE